MLVFVPVDSETSSLPLLGALSYTRTAFSGRPGDSKCYRTDATNFIINRSVIISVFI
jgi:hypothetical protein